jgi:hypothetical protein
MNSWKRMKSSMAVLVSCFIAAFCTFSARAQAQEPQEVAGVDQHRTGAYRALASLSFEAFKKGDLPRSAQLARILERTWVRGEEYGGEKSIRNTKPSLYAQIDQAMDQYVHPLTNCVSRRNESSCSGALEPTKVEAAYKAYLEKLKVAD